MTQQLMTTKEELVEYGRNMNMSAELECKLESYSENSDIFGFQLVGISLEDLYAENWAGIFEGAEYEWGNYKDVVELTREDWGHTLHPDEAEFLIKTMEEGPKSFFVGLVCNGVVVTSFEREAEEEDEDEEELVATVKSTEEQTEPEKTPLELLAQRTAEEHEAAFGKMMEAMVAMDPNEVQVALTELNACRERAKEICGLTEEWRVKVEAEMKRQWEERQD